MTAPGLRGPVAVPVATPTGNVLEVMGPLEQQRYTQSLIDYQAGVTFTERSDLEDLERILFMELMCFRWSCWLASGRDYDGNLISSDDQLRKWINDYGSQIQKAKESLRLDRKGREGDKSANFAERWQALTDHAKQFGITRERQLGRALEILQGLFAIIATYDRCDQEERDKLGFPDEAAIVDYMRESRAHYDEIDLHFRTHAQRMWVRNP